MALVTVPGMNSASTWSPSGFDLEVEPEREGPVTLAEAELQLGLVLVGVVARLKAEAANIPLAG